MDHTKPFTKEIVGPCIIQIRRTTAANKQKNRRQSQDIYQVYLTPNLNSQVNVKMILNTHCYEDTKRGNPIQPHALRFLFESIRPFIKRYEWLR